MSNTNLRRIAAALLIGSPVLMLAQAPSSASSSGVKVFLANNGGVDNATMVRAYKAMAVALKQRDGFSLVSQPARANLVVSLRCEDKEDVKNGNTSFDHIVHLAVIDPATHQSLWTVEERGPFPVFQLSDGRIWGKNFTKVADKLADDLHQAQATGQFTPAANAGS